MRNNQNKGQAYICLLFLSDFQDNFQGDFSEFLTSCFQGKKGWYRISQNDEVGKLPHRSVFGERLELII